MMEYAKQIKVVVILRNSKIYFGTTNDNALNGVLLHKTSLFHLVFIEKVDI